MTSSQHVYEIRPRKDKRGVDLISDMLPFGRLWMAQTANMLHRNEMPGSLLLLYWPEPWQECDLCTTPMELSFDHPRNWNRV